jgi:methyl-accepting chemotaxis protein
MKNEKQRTSIRRSVIIFSAILFTLILIGGSIVFIIAMGQTVRINTGHELVQSAEIERIKLEASVNGEIALAMKMATSPLIIQHFLTPDEPTLKRRAFDEIESYRLAFASQTVFWASDIDKEFYFDENNHYTVDAEDPGNYWYKMTLYETEKYNFNINYNPEAKKIMLWINATVFDTSKPSNMGRGKGLPIGLVGTGIDLTAFITSIYKGYKGSAALYLFNEDKEITGASDSSLVTEKVKIDSHLGHIGEEIIKGIPEVKKSGFYSFNMSGDVTAVGQIPALSWYIAAIQHVGVSEVLGTSMTFLFLAMIAVIAVIFLIFYVYISQMIKPMNKMVSALDQISVDWDLTKRLHLHRRDEIGTLGEFFNTTFEKIRGLLLEIKEKTVSLSDTGNELTSFMTITKNDIDGINVNIQKMRGEILSQSDVVNSSANSMEKVIKEIDELNKNITIQANSVAQSSSAIEEMLANIDSVTRTLVKNTANINSLAESSQAGRMDLQKVSSDIQEIAQESEGLLQINSVMNSIAAQTNLLSMNAAIEAAHAGEAGKGFAVVADEIRKLAENSGKQSKTISGVLKKIKTMIDAITKSTGIVLERFGTIENEIQTVSNQESQIRSAMEEQSEGSRQILEAVTQLNTVTGEVRKSSADMIAESQEVLNQSTSLKSVTNDIAEEMDNMTKNADEISSSFTRVQEITTENNKNINVLSKGVAQFKVE